MRTWATTRGAARVAVDVAPRPQALALLMHGAGGDMTADVLVSVRDALVDHGVTVARIDQPYRVAGRRAPAPAAQLDEVAVQVVARLRADHPGPLVLGGKSSGARVACRVASSVDAAAVLALGFPLHPPGRPDRSRAEELLAVECPVLVLQGGRDAFGTPAEIRAVLPRRSRVTLHEVAGGDHSFHARAVDGRSTRDCLAEVAATGAAWVAGQLAT